ncbi:hypothetical protein V520_11820 [Pseudomonas putida KG-4]|nr:hypothetical protein V520_11820 [Pseudomonas putida KG-4]
MVLGAETDFLSRHHSGMAADFVGAALCRDGLRSSPRTYAPAQTIGAAAQPIATQGRSYTGQYSQNR